MLEGSHWVVWTPMWKFEGGQSHRTHGLARATENMAVSNRVDRANFASVTRDVETNLGLSNPAHGQDDDRQLRNSARRSFAACSLKSVVSTLSSESFFSSWRFSKFLASLARRDPGTEKSCRVPSS